MVGSRRNPLLRCNIFQRSPLYQGLLRLFLRLLLKDLDGRGLGLSAVEAHRGHGFARFIEAIGNLKKEWALTRVIVSLLEACFV